jgi:Fanconi anemia group J protein
VEPTKQAGRGGDAFDQVLADYKAAAGVGRGAVLLAVLRGRASEGLNFSHAHARGVVMVSIAYPPLYEHKVMAKRNRTNGEAWYVGQAFKVSRRSFSNCLATSSSQSQFTGIH